MTTKRQKAQEVANELCKDLGIRGWIIVDGFNWYGEYVSKDEAESKIGRLDSLGMEIQGIVVRAQDPFLTSL